MPLDLSSSRAQIIPIDLLLGLSDLKLDDQLCRFLKLWLVPCCGDLRHNM